MLFDITLGFIIVIASGAYVINDMREFRLRVKEYAHKLDRDRNKDNPDYF